MSEPPSGRQFEISSGDQHATIVEVGGGVREYAVGGRDVLEPYRREDICDGGHGTVLAPWPNRLGDGRYSFEGIEHQLAISEPARHNAIHGLLRWRSWSALEHEPGRVLMGARLHPEPGYPFDVSATVEYRLGPDGLTVTTSARNLGAGSCPFGAGQHPYLSPGEGSIDACTLELPARTLIATDPERGLPSGRREPVAGGPLDFLQARPVGAAAIDSPFTDLLRGADGRARTRLTAADGSCVELWVDEGYPVLELFTGDTLAPSRRRTALAVEPMTCPPDAFRSGEHLIVLPPGSSSSFAWGVALKH
jgi:aldose 1-epimerase